MALKKRKVTPTPAEEAAFIGGAKADQAEGIVLQAKSNVIDQLAPPSPSVHISERVSYPTDSYETEPIDPHQFVHRSEWPILPSLEPFLAEGRSDLDKPFIMRMKEDFWNSVERHCKALGIDKSKWVRQAIENQMAAEQQFFLKHQK